LVHLPSFLVLPPPASRSPRVPYTTLFRSSSITGKPLVIVTGGFGHGFSLKQTDIGLQGCLISFRITQLGDNRQTILDLFNGEFEDRKSTRLNSSHVSISYAVFCLNSKRRR